MIQTASDAIGKFILTIQGFLNIYLYRKSVTRDFQSEFSSILDENTAVRNTRMTAFQ